MCWTKKSTIETFHHQINNLKGNIKNKSLNLKIILRELNNIYIYFYVKNRIK